MHLNQMLNDVTFGRRVVFTTHTSVRSGGELALVNLAKELLSLGHWISVVTASDGPLVADLQSLGVEVVVLPLSKRVAQANRRASRVNARSLSNMWVTLRYALKLRRLLVRLNPEIVHSNSLKAGVYTSVACIGLPSKFVWHLRDYIDAARMGAASSLIARCFMSIFPDAIVCDTWDVAKISGISLDKFVIAPSGVNLGRFGDIKRVYSRENICRLAFVGRISPWKGQDLFLDAMALLARTDWSAVIVGTALFGEEDFAQSLRRRAASFSGRVSFLGEVEDVTSVLSQCDVLVHASREAEPFGQVVLEGMAAALPVVAANDGGPRLLISDNVDGLLFTPNDPQSLALAVGKLIASPALRRKLGHSAAIRAAEFDVRSMAAVIATMYRNLAQDV